MEELQLGGRGKQKSGVIAANRDLDAKKVETPTVS